MVHGGWAVADAARRWQGASEFFGDLLPLSGTKSPKSHVAGLRAHAEAGFASLAVGTPAFESSSAPSGLR